MNGTWRCCQLKKCGSKEDRACASVSSGEFCDFIFPWLRDLWPAGKNGPLRWVWNSAAMSIACQITTGPLAWLWFGTFPKYFLLTNLIALPMTGVIISSAILATFLNAYGSCPEFIIQTTERLTFILRECLDIIASL